MAITTTVLAVLAVANATRNGTSSSMQESGGCGRVWLTVSSLEFPALDSSTLYDALEINWDFRGCGSIPSMVALYKGEPGTTGGQQELWSGFTSNAESGFLISSTSFVSAGLPGGWVKGARRGARSKKLQKGPQCLWAWAAAFGQDRSLMKKDCLKIQPTWMEDNAVLIQDVPLPRLAIAGTHNAGSYAYDTELSSVTRDRWVLCQDRSIWTQLVHGIRYFDLRIAHYEFYENVDDRFWLNHNLIRVRPLVPLLREIKEFLDNTNEIVFLDAHHFPVGFYDGTGAPLRGVHGALLELLRRELDPHLAEWSVHGPSPTYRQLVSAGTRLVLSYVDNVITSENPSLWPNLPHLWANTNDDTRLFEYLDAAIVSAPLSNARNLFHSAMAQTTPATIDILLGRGSLRDNADLVSRRVSERLRTTWRQKANIVSTDFFLGNDVVEAAIEISKERALVYRNES